MISLDEEMNNNSGMTDDVTSEPLHQLVNRQEYLSELKSYSKLLTSLRLNFHSLSSLSLSLSTLRGDQPMEELQCQTVLTLCQIIAHEPKRRGCLPRDRITAIHEEAES
jgi:hypothetical protein